MTTHPYEITCQELRALLAKNSDLQLIDVRNAEKHASYNIGGVLIPSDELLKRAHELDPNKLTITYCTSGRRSLDALALLLSVGFTSVKSLAGGVTEWQASQLV